jgi:hypothetical protein
MRIPKEAKPHEVAILMLWQQGKNAKQIAYDLHYRHSQPVRRVITRWKDEPLVLSERAKSLSLIERLVQCRDLDLLFLNP